MLKSAAITTALLFSATTFAAQLCGTVEIVQPKAGTQEMPTYWMHVPNRVIPEPGYYFTYQLLDDNQPILRSLVDGKYECVIGNLMKSTSGRQFVVTGISHGN